MYASLLHCVLKLHEDGSFRNGLLGVSFRFADADCLFGIRAIHKYKFQQCHCYNIAYHSTLLNKWKCNPY